MRPAGAVDAGEVEHFLYQLGRVCLAHPDLNIEKFGLQNARSALVAVDSWQPLQFALISAYRRNSSLVSLLVEICLLRQVSQHDVQSDVLVEFIENRLPVLAGGNRTGEIIWLLFMAARLRLPLSAAKLKPLYAMDNAFVALLVVLLDNRGLVRGAVDRQLWDTSLNQDGLRGPMWLYAYEAVGAGLLPGATDAYIASDPYFSLLHSKKVRFLDIERGYSSVTSVLRGLRQENERLRRLREALQGAEPPDWDDDEAEDDGEDPFEGLYVAVEIGERLLVGEARAVWQRALGLGPAHAIAFTLQNLRLPDVGDPAGSVVWGPADHVAGAPRDRVRLLGLSTNVWPRRTSDDPIVPNHIVNRDLLAPVSRGRYDRACFELLKKRSTEFGASYSRRGSRGTLQTPGPLWPADQEIVLHRLRVPEHAFSENDRLLARPSDASSAPRVVRSRSAWSNWLLPSVTPHDGLTSKNHAVVLRALGQPLTSGPMRRLLRDQLGFAWSEGMGWRAGRNAGFTLELSAADFGILVHEVLARALASLDAGPGIARAGEAEKQDAFLSAIGEVDRRWTLEKTIPPARLWNAILALTMELGLTALSVDEDLIGKVDTWTEVGFGGVPHGERRTPPWKADESVTLPGTNLKVAGRIDRLDIAKSRNGFMVTDYKTAIKVPSRSSILDGGRGVQPLLYVAAAQELLPDARRKVGRVVYLREGEVATKMDGDALEDAMAGLVRSALAAEEVVRDGSILPGPDALEGEAPFRLALPADIQLYRRTKSAALAALQAKVAAGWRL